MHFGLRSTIGLAPALYLGRHVLAKRMRLNSLPRYNRHHTINMTVLRLPFSP